MIKKYIFILFLLPVVLFSQERISLTGNVFDGISFYHINEANIYNFSTKKYSFTNKEGNFEIFAKTGDTIVITKPAYQQVLLVITPEIIEKKRFDVGLFYKAIVLREVNVYALPATYEQFKKEFVNTNFTDINKFLNGTTLSDEDRIQLSPSGNLLSVIPGKVGEAIRSPITALYNRFSKKMKMERLFQEMVDKQDEVDRLPLKYNRDLVTSLTGLEGEELLDFMTFCKFSYYDLVRWSPELIIAEIKRKHGDYEFYKALQDN